MTTKNPVQISFRGLPHSNELEETIRAQAAHLERFSDRLHGVNVVVAPDEQNHQTGVRYKVSLRVHVPGKELVVGDHPPRAEHVDASVAVHDAFKAMVRQVKEWSEKRRDHHEAREASLEQ